jgi:hypothetical protein
MGFLGKGEVMKKLLLLVLGIMMLASPALTFAHEQTKCVGDPLKKLSSGITEAAFCWLDVPLAIGYFSEKHDPLTGLVVGSVAGSALAVKDCVEGTVEATFFYVPPYKEKEKGFMVLLDKFDSQLQEKYW